MLGIDIDKDIVRRILAKHYHPALDADGGPSWLTFIGHIKDSLWSIDLFRCESILLPRVYPNSQSSWMTSFGKLIVRDFISSQSQLEYEFARDTPSGTISGSVIPRLDFEEKGIYASRTLTLLRPM